MDIINSIFKKTRTPEFSDDGADDPDQLVGVRAAELFEWAWLAAELADWFAHADQATTLDYNQYFDGFRTANKTAVFLTHISERIAALLDGDRGQP